MHVLYNTTITRNNNFSNMLSKFEDFFKLSKSDQCSMYTAISRDNGQHVLLKRLTNKISWDEMLKNRNLQFSQKSKMFPKMIEIFKNKHDFYIVYEATTGKSLKDISNIGKMDVEDFYIIFDDLCTYVKQLKAFLPAAYVLPQWIFLHRNTVKILHYQPFFINKEAASNDHVYLYKVQNQIVETEKNSESESSVIPVQQKRNMMLNLGLIAYNLITGHKQRQPETKDDYFSMIYEISQSAQKKILKITRDKELAGIVSKMLSMNVFEMPDIEKVYNLVHRKASQIAPRKKMYASNIQIELEKIKLDFGKPEPEEPSPRRKLRICCLEKQASIQRIRREMRVIRQQKSAERKVNSVLKQQHPFTSDPPSTNKKNKIFLPLIKSPKKSHLRHKTMVDLMNTTNSKPLMFGNRSTILKR